MSKYILSLSYGKDSLACLGAIEKLGWQLDGIIHAEVWATDTIPADLPPMVEFKKKADQIIKDRWGIEVQHVCAMSGGGCKKTYQSMFYHSRQKGKHIGEIYGFPTITGGWCRNLKIDPQEIFRRGILSTTEKGEKKGDDNRIPDGERIMVQFRTEDGSTKFLGKSESEVVQYLGIAVDEPKRIERHKDKANILLPLVEAGWSEDYCRKWCEENDLLSPIYTTGTRGGCWFCHMQRIDSLRELRHGYPDLWALMLKWDTDSPVTFRVGVTVHDLDRRFELEDRQGKLW